eukprot:scaffold401_cov144-Skeletonema_dohrnii-CCMP3373.AAC.27
MANYHGSLEAVDCHINSVRYVVAVKVAGGRFRWPHQIDRCRIKPNNRRAKIRPRDILKRGIINFELMIGATSHRCTSLAGVDVSSRLFIEEEYTNGTYPTPDFISTTAGADIVRPAQIRRRRIVSLLLLVSSNYYSTRPTDPGSHSIKVYPSFGEVRAVVFFELREGVSRPTAHVQNRTGQTVKKNEPSLTPSV